MPYSFTQIEKDKSQSIGFVFSFLVFFYFLTGWCISVILKNYLLWAAVDRYSENQQYPLSLLTIPEALTTLMIAFFIGAAHWLFSIQDIIPKMIKVLGAEPLNPNDSYHQMLQNIIDEVSVATGGKKIEGVVVPTMAMNAFALADFKGGAVIGVTEGLLSRLNRAQIEAVVGHEAAHIVSGDCLSTTVTTSIFALYNGLLNGLSMIMRGRRYSSRRGGGILVIVLLIFLVLSITRFLSLMVRMFISREREFRADAVSVRLTRDPLSLAQALYNISHRWRGAGMSGEDFEAIFIVNPKYSFLDEGEGFFADLFSTHPPVEKRLHVLLDLAKTDMQSLESSYQQNLLKPKETIPERTGFADEQENKMIPTPIASTDDDACPRCHSPLTQFFYEGLPILKCTQCEGILVQEKDVQRIIIREDMAFSEKVQRIARLIEGGRQQWGDRSQLDLKTANMMPCPRCAREKYKMIRMFYTAAYPVEVDKCLNCGYVWFDKDELEILQCLIENYTKKDQP